METAYTKIGVVVHSHPYYNGIDQMVFIFLIKFDLISDSIDSRADVTLSLRNIVWLSQGRI